jgi:hypothetical protein
VCFCSRRLLNGTSKEGKETNSESKYSINVSKTEEYSFILEEGKPKNLMNVLNLIFSLDCLRIPKNLMNVLNLIFSLDCLRICLGF